MPDANDWNERNIAEFRANGGRVGGNFEGAPMVLVHHEGRKSGREYVNPVMYLPDDADTGTIYVFATKAGAPSNPDWYFNLSATGAGAVERGTETYSVTVRELQGDERDRIYDEQARLYPGFADYAQRTAGIRTIPAGTEALLLRFLRRLIRDAGAVSRCGGPTAAVGAFASYDSATVRALWNSLTILTGAMAALGVVGLRGS